MCLGAFSAYPKIQICGKIESRENPGFEACLAKAAALSYLRIMRNCALHGRFGACSDKPVTTMAVLGTGGHHARARVQGPGSVPGPRHPAGLRISLNRVRNLDVSDFRLLLISEFLDMRKTFPGTFQDFNFEMLKSRQF